jgi:UDP-glucose 4-epimerase
MLSSHLLEDFFQHKAQMVALCVWQVRGTDYNTSDGTCIRDYIHVSDLVDAHVKAMLSATPQQVGIYNVGTGRGVHHNPVCLLSWCHQYPQLLLVATYCIVCNFSNASLDV